jgi:hypothetical protein
MGVGSQPHSPPELVRISPPRPTDPWTRANTAPTRCRLPVRGPRPGNTAHARRAPSAVRTRPLLRCRARPWACERWRGERHRQTPGDHATNLGATMLVLLCMAPLAYFPWEDPARCDPESPWLLSVQNALALISSLYYTHAPQLPHASPPTRAPHIYVSSPSPRRLLASPQVEVLVS